MATFLFLDRPTAILFLRGEKDVGKGLLVRGLARLWEADAPTKMQAISGEFQTELRKCPLVIIQEGKWNKHVDATTLLRELVTDPSRNANRKHVDPIELRGYARFILTANNFNIFANDSHALTPEDRAAVAQRFLESNPSPEAGRILLELDPDERDRLASDNHIAEHVLWLAQTRQVQSHGRFLVEGNPEGGFAMRIITEDGRWGSWVVEWLARYLSDPTRIEREHGHLLSRDGNRVLVNPEAVIDTFNAVLKNKQQPQSAEILNALRSLSTGTLVPFPSGDRTGFEILDKEVAAGRFRDDLF
jgi:hypothetical protein